MALTPHISIIPSNNPSIAGLLDDSTGSDVAITGRIIYIYAADGSLFIPATSWAIANASILLSILENDQSLSIRVDWINVSNTVLYTYSLINAFVKYEQQGIYELTQAQTANPSIAQDQNFYQNKLQLLCEVLSAQNAIDTGQDYFAAQLCIARGAYLLQNSNYFL